MLDYYGFNHSGEFGGGILMILIWILLIGGIVILVKYLIHNNHKTCHSEDKALEVLKERYAKSEIDKKEFEEKKKDLLS